MKQLFLPVLLPLVLFCAGPVYAQKGELKGILQSKESKESLPYATVAVYTAADTAMVTFRMSDEKGVFRVSGLPVNQQLRAVVTMLGYKVYRKEFLLPAEQPVLDLGVVGMEQASNELGEVVILAEIPPVLVRNDTLEFNAASFKTLPTSLVEDLLKKLPGVMVDTEGNITVNGKSVQKILVDGKEFFGSDPKVATRNLPADVIEKVQVMNDPDALRRDPDMAESEIPQVINLTFKKGIKKGMFGKLYGGGGTKERYEAGGILNFFRDTTQVSVLGYSNNLNRAGFGMQDIRRIGGFDRSGFNSISVWSDGGFALNGISFGGTGQGIQQSSGGGANFNTVTNSGIKLNLQYFMGDIREDVEQIVNTEQFLRTDTLNSRRTRTEYINSQSHRVGGKIEWKIDSLTDLSITPSASFSFKSSNQDLFTRTYESPDDLLNESANDEVIDNNSFNFYNTLSFERNFRKKGRNFTLFSVIDKTETVQDQFNEVINIFYQPEERTTYLDQLRNTDRNELNISNSLAYTEPIIKDLSAVFRLSSEYFQDENILETYAADQESGLYDEPVPALSEGLGRSGWRNYLTTGFKWKIKDFTIQPGVRFTSLNIENDFEKITDIPQDYFYIFPMLNANWKDFRFNYSVDLREPNANDLQPVLNNTNPLFIQYGNPDLKPTISNNFNLSFWKFDRDKSINYNAYIYGTIENDAVTRSRAIDENGVQTSTPVNTDGNWNFSGSGRVMKDFKYNNKNKFSIGGRMGFYYTNRLILLNSIRSYGETIRFTPSLEARINLNDKLEVNQSYSLSYQRSMYENNAFDKLSFTTQSSKSEVVLRMPNKLVWEASYEYWYNSNVPIGLQKSYGRLNGAVTFLFMKNDRAQLKLSVYDLLNQNITAYRTIRENMIEDSQITTLSRYGLLTFTYNIRNFGGKVGGSSNPIFWF